MQERFFRAQANPAADDHILHEATGRRIISIYFRYYNPPVILNDGNFGPTWYVQTTSKANRGLRTSYKYSWRYFCLQISSRFILNMQLSNLILEQSFLRWGISINQVMVEHIRSRTIVGVLVNIHISDILKRAPSPHVRALSCSRLSLLS